MRSIEAVPKSLERPLNGSGNPLATHTSHLLYEGLPEDPKEALQKLDQLRKELGSQRKLAEGEMQRVWDRYSKRDCYYSRRGYLYRLLDGVGLGYYAEKIIPLKTTITTHEAVKREIENVDERIDAIRLPSPLMVKAGGAGAKTGIIALEVVEATQPIKPNGKEESLMPVAAEIPQEEGGNIGNWWSWKKSFGKKLMQLVTNEESTRDTKQRVVVGVTREGIREVVGKKIREKDLDRLMHAINRFEAGSTPKRILENVGGLWEVQAGDYRIILNSLGGELFSLEDIGPREGIFKSHRISPKRFS